MIAGPGARRSWRLGYAWSRSRPGRPAREVVRVAGISEAQEIFGGIPQEGDRLGSSDAPVTIQVFNDLQCSSCRADFLGTIPGLVEDYARPGDVKLLMRHYSVAENPLELGFFGAEAAAEQGYGWQYTYLFFRNQDEAERFGIDDRASSTRSPARSGNSTCPNGRNTSKTRAARRRDHERLEGYEELGHGPRDPHPPGGDRQRPERDPRPCRTAPAWREIERAIEAVN